MLGTFQNLDDVYNWARTQADAAFDRFGRTGALVSLGYALAMADIAQSGEALQITTESHDDEARAEIRVVELQAA